MEDTVGIQQHSSGGGEEEREEEMEEAVPISSKRIAPLTSSSQEEDCYGDEMSSDEDLQNCSMEAHASDDEDDKDDIDNEDELEEIALQEDLLRSICNGVSQFIADKPSSACSQQHFGNIL